MTQRYTGDALDADSAALAAAGSEAEEALALHRSALAVLDDGWGGESGSAAIDLVRRQCGEAADLVEALHGAAAELRALRDSLSAVGADYGVDADLMEAAGGPGDAPAPEYAQAAARLSDRAVPVFAAPAPPPLPPAALTSPAAWPAPAMPAWSSSPGSGPMPNLGAAAFPNLGGTVAGLVAQIADALSSDVPEDGSLVAATPDAEPAAEPTDTPPPAPRETAAREPTPAPPPQPPAPPAVVSLSRTDDVVPQKESAPSPLLAAELPPPPEPSPTPPPPEPAPPPGPAPAVAADTKTPCEIAADELPQVGQ